MNETDIREAVVKVVADADLKVSGDQTDKLVGYLKLLATWNKTFNLTAVRRTEDMIYLHLADCLSVVPYFRQAKKILDIGSGGGLPGMVLAILYPETTVAMIDSVSKKTAFLQQAATELGLKNTIVHTGRVEKLNDGPIYDVITARAFSTLKDLTEKSRNLLAPGGVYLAMKGQFPKEEIDELGSDYTVSDIIRLTVAGLDAERHLIVMQRH